MSKGYSCEAVIDVHIQCLYGVDDFVSFPRTRILIFFLCFLLPFAAALGDSGESNFTQNMHPLCSAASGGGTLESAALPGILTQRALEGFCAAAFSSEFGDEGRNTLIRWEVPLHIFIKGTPTEDDNSAIDAMLKDLRSNVPALPQIDIVQSESEANMLISFVPYAHLSDYLTTYKPDNWIAVACDVTDQMDRNYLIRQEFVNMLGLTNDISFAKESIICTSYTRSQDLSSMDYQMLSLLYGPHIKPGMTLEQAKATIRKAFPDLKP
jgi:hypothetical protein